MTITKKATREIYYLVTKTLDIGNVKEFEENGKLFEDPPETWGTQENNICEYQNRISLELLGGLQDILGCHFGMPVFDKRRRHEPKK